MFTRGVRMDTLDPFARKVFLKGSRAGRGLPHSKVAVPRPVNQELATTGIGEIRAFTIRLVVEVCHRPSIASGNNDDSTARVLDRETFPVRGKASVRRMCEWMNSEDFLSGLQFPDEYIPAQDGEASLIR
jgi:hypothetical protein